MTEFVTNTKEQKEVLLKVCSNCTVQCACTTVASCIARLTLLGNWMLLTWTDMCVQYVDDMCLYYIGRLPSMSCFLVPILRDWAFKSHSMGYSYCCDLLLFHPKQYTILCKCQTGYRMNWLKFLVKVIAETKCTMTLKFHAWNFSYLPQ